MKYFIIAGEASGDLHAANLVKELLRKDPSITIDAWGGDLMKSAGATIHKDYRELAFMGFAEVAMNIRTILNNFRLIKKQILAIKPDVLIFIDYPGFNLRLAKWAKEHQFKTIYYIAPQAWAWKSGRVKILKKYIDELITILPFEKKWFEDRGKENKYFGHPLADTQILDIPDRETFLVEHHLPDRPIIALLPGSRQQELQRIQDTFLAVVRQFPEYQFIIAGAPGKAIKDYKAYTHSGIKVLFHATYPLLHLAKAALVTSGTATLETAMIGTPQIVCYKASWGTYWIAKSMIKIPYLSLVNLIANEKVVEELIQEECNPERITGALKGLLASKNLKQAEKYEEIQRQLAEPGVSARVAEYILFACK